jgi:hypothetical protein
METTLAESDRQTPNCTQTLRIKWKDRVTTQVGAIVEDVAYTSILITKEVKMRPEIKIISVSNVYCRLMKFNKAGDQEVSHSHTYDHGTLLASGKMLVEEINDEDEVVSSKEFTAPTFVYIPKDITHVLTSLEDSTVATCIHALRTNDETIIDPDYFVREVEFADNETQRTEDRKFIKELFNERGLDFKPLVSRKD